MHPDQTFRKTADQHSLSFAATRGFGTLCINGEPMPLLAHIPFCLNANQTEAEFHLVRSNPIARALKAPGAALLSVSGPDSYISPDWYGIDDQVPTWNYVAVHLRGTLERLDQTALPALLDRLSENFESRLAPKPQWLATKMEPETLGRMMQFIVPFRLSIEEVQSTWKLGQNKPDDVRNAAADQVQVHGIGQEIAALSSFMLAPPKS
ncbi:MAG: FMN-binding negative transcriptional regulator [Marinosulfonomonas sp.]|nr:FMN-binding negative transcriptional regulator [Marinosulfonomonas sp.]